MSQAVSDVLESNLSLQKQIMVMCGSFVELLVETKDIVGGVVLTVQMISQWREMDFQVVFNNSKLDHS